MLTKLTADPKCAYIDSQVISVFLRLIWGSLHAKAASKKMVKSTPKVIFTVLQFQFYKDYLSSKGYEN